MDWLFNRLNMEKNEEKLTEIEKDIDRLSEMDDAELESLYRERKIPVLREFLTKDQLKFISSLEEKERREESEQNFVTKAGLVTVIIILIIVLITAI